MKKSILILTLLTSNFLFAQEKHINKLSRQEVKALATLGQLWGFLKYYHPAVSTGRWDWDSVLIQKIPLYIAAGKNELNKVTNDWLDELGNVDTCKSCDNNIPDSLKFNLDFNWVENQKFTGQLKNRLYFIRDNRNNGVTHYVTYERSFAKITNEKTYKPYWTFQYPSVEYRLLLLFRYWNIINYFSPYKYLNGRDWNHVLKEKIPIFVNVADTLGYHLEYIKLLSSLNDGHSTISMTPALENFFGKYYWVPFECRYIKHKFVVSKIINDSIASLINIKVGDIITSINGEKVKSTWKSLSGYICASNNFDRQFNFSQSFMFRSTDGKFVVNRIRMGKIISNTFSLPAKPSLVTDNHPWKIIDDSIGYVNMGDLLKTQVHSAMNDIANTKGIIFDIRNYPKGTWSLIAEYLCKDYFTMAKICFPSLSYPGVFKFFEPVSYGKENPHPYSGKVILLVDESTQSHGEFSAMGLQAATRTVTLGNTTAGADGDVTDFIELPGSFIMRFSGLGVYYPDGTITQRKGIKIDIKVRPTIKGLLEGKDEPLERAIRFINTGL